LSLSVLPPTGENWFVTTHSNAVEFFKAPFLEKLRDTQRPVEERKQFALTIVAGARIVNYTELLERVRKPNPPRYQLLEGKASLDSYLGWDCVRWAFTAENHDVRRFPGSVFILTGYGFWFLHPERTRIT
jgi:hypothetical protein